MRNYEYELGEVRGDNLSKVLLLGMSAVAKRYGWGEGDGERPLKYHNAQHTLDVWTAVTVLGDLALVRGLISEDEWVALQVAAIYHDIEQDLGGGKNEAESARVAQEAMEKIGGFGDDQIERVGRYILATRVAFDEKGYMSQAAGSDLGEQIMADADLCALGQNIYQDRSRRLALEFVGRDELSEEEEKKFWLGQVRFLESREYITPLAKEVFDLKSANLELARQQALT